MCNIIKGHFALPLKNAGLKEGSKKDYTITVKIGGGKKTAVICFACPKKRDELSNHLNKIGDQHDVKVELNLLDVA